jgi:uncharacterized protein YjbI with pentapeptide repeats
MSSGLRRERLIQQLRSPDNAHALEALAELRERGVLEDGALQGVDLDDANLRGADLTDANLEGTALIGANLQGANLRGANLKQAGLRRTNLQDAALPGVNLSGASLVGANLTRARLDDANLQRTILTDANLHRTILSNARLGWAKLMGAKLHATDLSWANLEGADLSEADLLGAYLSHANLSDTENLADGQLTQAYVLWGAVMPDGSHYDGRFRLAGDLAAAKSRGFVVVDSDQLAIFYEVARDVYESGQEWARDHLEGLRAETNYVQAVTALWAADDPPASDGT